MGTSHSPIQLFQILNYMQFRASLSTGRYPQTIPQLFWFSYSPVRPHIDAFFSILYFQP